MKLYFFPYLHQTTTCWFCAVVISELYFFPYLHQTTTVNVNYYNWRCCISFLIYIKPQLECLSEQLHASCISFLIYIKPQLPAYVLNHAVCCISFLIYIKPQLHLVVAQRGAGCISFLIYIKPQLGDELHAIALGCISFLIYIKPQLPEGCPYNGKVVFLSLSTSNHNARSASCRTIPVVFLSLSTSNHNSIRMITVLTPVVFLSLSTSNHNICAIPIGKYMLYFFPYLHQTTTWSLVEWYRICCISFLIYIKPQREPSK